MEDLCFCILQPQEFWDVYQRIQLVWKSEKIKHHLHDGKPVMRPKASESMDSKSDLSQKHIRELLHLVTPFTTVRYPFVASGTKAGFGWHFLQTCAKRLLYEIGMLSFSAGLRIDIVGRVKSLYSTYTKAKKKNIPIEEVYDVLALRVIVTEGESAEVAIGVCYNILDLVRHLWKHIPPELDDYIALPKRSGYQSLHISVTGPGDVPFEVQIRTASMDKSAECGQAAHWCYKEYGAIEAEESTSLSIRDVIWGKNAAILGRPVVRIRDGSWRDGIVIGMENEGLAIIVAINITQRISHSYGSFTVALLESYKELLEYVEKRNWSVPGCGDFHAAVERYVLCSDHAYHLIDHYGLKHSTVVRPILTFDSYRSLTSHVASLNAGTQGNAIPLTEEDEELKPRITHLRSMLKETENNPMAPAEFSTVHVVIWPEGKIQCFPRGTTAADVMAWRSKENGDGENDRDQMLVNVNRSWVPSDTLLRNGDSLHLQDEEMHSS